VAIYVADGHQMGLPLLAEGLVHDWNWILSELSLRNHAPALGRAVLAAGVAVLVTAIVLLAACQALDLRGSESGSRRGRALRDALRKEVPWLAEDRRQDLDIERVLALYRSASLPVGSLRPPPGA